MAAARSGSGVGASFPMPPEVLEPLLHGFQELGLSPYESRVLVALLHRGSANSVDLAELSGVPRTAVYPVLQGLGKRGLAERVPGPGPAVWASHGRDEVIVRLKAAEEQRLREHRQRADDVRGLLDRLLPDAPPEVALPFVHIVPDARQMKAMYEQLLGEARTEVMMFTRPAATWTFVNPNQAVLDMLAREVKVRVLYEADQWDDPSFEAFRTEMTIYHEAGMEARLTDELPVTLVVVDSSAALVHMLQPVPTDGYPISLHVEHPGFAQVTAIAFEQLWATARPLRAPRRVRSRDRLSARAALRSAAG